MNRHPLARALLLALAIAIALTPAASATLNRSYDREDYPGLTDEEYANFRAVATTGMGKNVLYRSSSPINPKLGRNEQAMAAVQAAGIRTVLNLADTDRNMRQYDGYAGSYYATLNVLPLRLDVDFTSDDYRDGLAMELRFLIEHEGPYLIHCTEGKDRTGFAVAVLECLMGATAEEVVEDYMLSFYNYYGVRPGTKKYNAIVKDNIARDLKRAFGVGGSNPNKASLASCAAVYLTELGLNLGEVEALKERLAGQ